MLINMNVTQRKVFCKVLKLHEKEKRNVIIDSHMRTSYFSPWMTAKAWRFIVQVISRCENRHCQLEWAIKVV